MTLKSRFTLIALGVLIFAVAAPILILYARGFRYDFKTHQILKTGTLIVRTQPTKASVTLNDQIQTGATPLNIRFLTPADYEIKITKPNYQIWSKRLPVRSQFVTWTSGTPNYVYLFLNSPKLLSTDPVPLPAPTPAAISIPELLQSLQIPVPKYSSGQVIVADSQIYLILDSTLYLLNGNLQKIYSPVTSAYFDSNSHQLIYSNANEIYLYSPQSQDSELILRNQTPITQPHLDWTTGYMFYINENQIKAIELDGRDQRNIFTILTLPADFQTYSISDAGDELDVTTQAAVLHYQLR